jgi:hypothetical protein
VKLGHLDLNKVAIQKTFLSRLSHKFCHIETRSTYVLFPKQEVVIHESLLFLYFIFFCSSRTCLTTFAVYGDVKKLIVNSDQKYWFHPKVCHTSVEQYTEVMNSPWYQRSV